MTPRTKKRPHSLWKGYGLKKWLKFAYEHPPKISQFQKIEKVDFGGLEISMFGRFEKCFFAIFGPYHTIVDSR